jgi:hypothetical protein
MSVDTIPAQKLLTVIGEQLVRRLLLATDLSSVTILESGEESGTLRQLLGPNPVIAVECKLFSEPGECSFDGMHRVDVVAFPKNSTLAVPFEVKLGLTGLTANAIDKWRRPVRGTNRRWRGSMAWILDQLPAQRSGLSVQTTTGLKPLNPTWCLVARRLVVERWKRRGWPTFQCARVVVFEDLAADLTEVNAAVRSCLEDLWPFLCQFESMPAEASIDTLGTASRIPKLALGPATNAPRVL